MNNIKLTYKTDTDSGIIEFFIDGNSFTEWSYEENPEAQFEEFAKIFFAGRKHEAAKLHDGLKSLQKEKKDDDAYGFLIPILLGVCGYFTLKYFGVL